jgi:hypothetical protein
MGNNPSANLELLQEYVKEISYYDCEKLDINKRMGSTGYIDMIDVSELGENNMMKGIDMYNRTFYVIKATYVYKLDIFVPVFITIFQRYTGDNNLWVGACNEKKTLLYSTGGLKHFQLEFIKDLIYKKEINLDIDIIQNMRLDCYPNDKFLGDPVDIDLCPVKVVFGHILLNR